MNGLWRNHDFVKLWAGQTVSVCGSLLSRVALPLTAVIVLHATPLQMSLLTAADLAPGLLAGPLAGVWVDRLRRKPLLIATDLARAVVLAAIPLLACLGRLQLVHLYFVALLVGVLTTFFDVAYSSYLPSIVSEDELVEGNSKLTATMSLSQLGSFGLGGWLVQWLTGPLAVLFDCASFIVSALCVGSIRAVEPAPAPPSEREGAMREAREGWRVVRDSRVLCALLCANVTMSLAFGMFSAVFMLFAARELGFTPGVLGMIFAVGGVTAFIGAVVTERVSRRFGVGRAMIVGVSAVGLGMLFIPLARGATLLALLLLVAQQLVTDPGYAIYQINQMSLRQAIASPQFLGRVNATMRFAELSAMLLGTLLGGAGGQAVGLRFVLAMSGLAAMASALWLWLSPVCGLREARSLLQAEAAEATTALASAQPKFVAAQSPPPQPSPIKGEGAELYEPVPSPIKAEGADDVRTSSLPHQGGGSRRCTNQFPPPWWGRVRVGGIAALHSSVGSVS